MLNTLYFRYMCLKNFTKIKNAHPWVRTQNHLLPRQTPNPLGKMVFSPIKLTGRVWDSENPVCDTGEKVARRASKVRGSLGKGGSLGEQMLI